MQKLSIIEKTELLQAENKNLRAQLGQPEPASGTITLTSSQRLEQERIQNDRLKSEVAANIPPPPPEKPVSKLKQIEARFQSDAPPRGQELESICKDLLGELEKRL